MTIHLQRSALLFGNLFDPCIDVRRAVRLWFYGQRRRPGDLIAHILVGNGDVPFFALHFEQDAIDQNFQYFGAVPVDALQC